MAVTHPTRREIPLKVVYYGPGMAGKGTSLSYLHNALRADARGQMISVVTGGDRTMFFDFFPPPTPRLQGNALRVQLYTALGDVRSESTHRGLLEGVDALVFVADSQRAREADNVEALVRLRQSLGERGLRLEQLPHVFAWNKRDLEDVVASEQLGALLNQARAPAFDTVATSGRGVFDTLKAVTGLLVGELTRRRVRHSTSPGVAHGGNGANGSHGVNGHGQPRRVTLTTDEGAGGPEQPHGERPGTAEADVPLFLRGEGDEAPPTFIKRARPSPPPRAQAVPELIDDTQIKPRSSSPTFLQPLAPEQSTTPSGLTRPVWLSQITPSGPLREQLHDMEIDLSNGHFAQAVRQATAIFHNLTDAAASLEVEEGQAWRALALGIPVERYQRFREAMRHAEAGTATMEDGLFALFFLLDASLRR